MSNCERGAIYLPSEEGGYYEGHPCPLCGGKGCDLKDEPEESEEGL